MYALVEYKGKQYKAEKGALLQVDKIDAEKGAKIDMEEIVYEIQSQLGITTRGVEIGYIQRGGEPTYYDRMLGVRWGVLAVQLLMQDMTNLALGIKHDKIFSVPLIEVDQALQEFRIDMVNDLRTLHGLHKI